MAFKNILKRTSTCVVQMYLIRSYVSNISKHHLLEDKIMIVFEISHLPRFEAQLQNDPAMATAIIGSYEKINDAR